jgi:hypothetical protein
MAEEAKKKRGRPKKVDSYAEFKPQIKDVFSTYVNDYRTLLEGFTNIEGRVKKKDWQILYEHVKTINELIGKQYPEYNYKLDTQWKLLDTIHEEMRKDAIRDFLSKHEIEDLYKGWLIFNNLSVYISESSKEMK